MDNAITFLRLEKIEAEIKGTFQNLRFWNACETGRFRIVAKQSLVGGVRSSLALGEPIGSRGAVEKPVK